MVERSTCAMSMSLSRRPLIRISVLAVAAAPKPRRSTEVFDAVDGLPNSDVSCTPGTCARMSGKLFDGECAISSAVITVEEAPTMPLNCRTPVPLPAPVPLPVLASDVPVPVPREGVALRTGRGTPPPSSISGRARVLFGSVGGLTSTGGSSLDATFCACASVALRARRLVARKIARRRLAAVMVEDMARDLGMTSVARHSEPRPAVALAGAGEANVCTPRPTSSRVTTADGRSPGSRVVTLRRLPRTEISQWHETKDSPLTVAGAAAALGKFPAPHSLLIPKRGTVIFI